MHDFSDLSKITSSYGVSGNETEAAKAVKEIFEPFCEDVSIDQFFNVTACQKGSDREGLKIMFAAHLDEIGFMVSEVTDKGYIRIRNIGGVDMKILPAHEVVVHGKKELPGVVCTKSIRGQTPDEHKKAGTVDDILIDVGYPAELLKNIVMAGDFVSLKNKFMILNDKYITTKALDDRCCIGIMHECAKEFEKRFHPSTFYYVSTTREETGAQGAIIASQRIKPDLAIVFDVGQGKSPDADHDGLFNLGAGPYIAIGPQLNSRLSKKMAIIAEEAGIPIQIAVSTGWTGTDASAIQILNRGIPCLLIGIPLRYMHTSIETVNIRDYKNAVRLVVEMINYIDRHREDLNATAGVL